ncbi:exodeoxyribonuclease VII small subunit [Chloroflexota bacterium]
MNSKEDLIDVNNLTYEEAYNELIGIVESLETKENSLAFTMEMYERGQALSDHCESLLNNAELKVRKIDREE